MFLDDLDCYDLLDDDHRPFLDMRERQRLASVTTLDTPSVYRRAFAVEFDSVTPFQITTFKTKNK